MGKADIFLDEDRISVVGGDVKLQDRDGNSRVTLTAWESTLDDVNSADPGTRAWLDGGAGRLELGENEEYDEVHTPEIWLDGPEGEIGIADDPATPRDSTILLSADERSVTIGGGGSLSLFGGDTAIEATAAPDDERYGSELSLAADNGFGGVRLRTVAGDGPQAPAGQIEVLDEGGDTGVEIDGELAGIKLGYAYATTQDLGGSEELGETTVSAGKSGRLLLDDGNLTGIPLLGDTEESSTVFEIRASEGSLEIGSVDDKNPRLELDASGRLEVEGRGGEGSFIIDPEAGVVEIPDGWHIKSGDDTVLR